MVNTVSELMTNFVFALYGDKAKRFKLKLWITIEELSMTKLANVHPGDVLLKDFLEPMGISQNRLARDISVPPRRINEIILGKRTLTADTALRLSRYFGNTEKFWMGLQDDYDLEAARKDIDGVLKKISSVAA